MTGTVSSVLKISLYDIRAFLQFFFLFMCTNLFAITSLVLDVQTYINCLEKIFIVLLKNNWAYVNKITQEFFMTHDSKYANP